MHWGKAITRQLGPACLAAALLVAPASFAASTTPAVLAKAPVKVDLVSRGRAGDAPGVTQGIELQGEIVVDTIAQDDGWRSMRMRLDLSCPTRSVWIREFQVFPEAGRSGVARAQPAPDHWMRPGHGAYLEGVVKALCGEAPAPGLQPVSAVIATPQAQTAPLAPSTAVPSATAAPAATLARYVAQIRAAPNETEARAALDGLSQIAGLSTTGLDLHVEQAHVHGQLYFRALIGGLASAADAKAFCAAVEGANGACFVRR